MENNIIDYEEASEILDRFHTIIYGLDISKDDFYDAMGLFADFEGDEKACQCILDALMDGDKHFKLFCLFEISSLLASKKINENDLLTLLIVAKSREEFKSMIETIESSM